MFCKAEELTGILIEERHHVRLREETEDYCL
jgi:hypothetical protein